jgi:hypothetical protein
MLSQLQEGNAGAVRAHDDVALAFRCGIDHAGQGAR